MNIEVDSSHYSPLKKTFPKLEQNQASGEEKSVFLPRGHADSDNREKTTERNWTRLRNSTHEKREATSSATWGDGMDGPGRGSRSRDSNNIRIHTWGLCEKEQSGTR